MADLSISDWVSHPRYRPLHVAMCSELAQLAVAEGFAPRGFNGYDPDAFLTGPSHAFESDSKRGMRTLTELIGSAGDDEAISATLAAMDAFNRGNAKSHSGIWRDIAVRKRKTEVPEQMMPAVEKGRVRAALFRAAVCVSQCDSLLTLRRHVVWRCRSHQSSSS